MRTINNPRQKQLFDPFRPMFSKLAYKRIRQGWQAVFRHVILKLMPVGELAKHFSDRTGHPTKELYSMAALLFIKEFKNWTTSQAVDAYMYHNEIQYALNLEPCGQSLCERTVERYQKIFVENELAANVMHDVIVELADALELDVSKQRLDSTHVFSDMATFGRTRLMGVAIKRFLTQAKSHNRDAYDALPEELRKRYEPSQAKLFGDVAKDGDSRSKLRRQVAQDMRFLIEQFAGNASVNARTTYKNLVTIFEQQCEIVDDAIQLKTHTGGNVMQNPSDPGATYDGHKGPGYQVQICETCSEENDVQLITSAIPQTAVESDTDALPMVLDDLDEQGLLPEMLLADTHYGSDENVQAAADKGVDLQSPVAGNKSDDPDKLNIDDFVVDEDTEQVVRCPAGHEPVSSEHSAATGKTTTVMPETACSDCDFRPECPVRRRRGRYVIEHTAKGRRLAGRRREQATDAFRDNYAIRAGIESSNSALKRRTGLGRLRVRGSPGVFHSLLMKCAGWNVLRAAASEKMRRKVAGIIEKATFPGCFATLRRRFHRLIGHIALLWLFSRVMPLRARRSRRCLAS